MNHGTYAAQLFMDGYNCAQAVVIAFCDVTGLEQSTAAALASSFGGGIGRMGEVCGAVSGMVMVAGHLYGHTEPNNDVQLAHYARTRELVAQFKEQAKGYLCRDLLQNLPAKHSPDPVLDEQYKSRPCARLVILAAQILDAYIQEHPIEQR